MGRPKITDERAEQILDAFEVCVARYGVEGATLDKIAKEAGLARALLRHHVGNRDELLELLIQRFSLKSKKSMEALKTQLPVSNRMAALISLLFDPKYSNTQFVLVASSLVVATHERPELANLLRQWVRSFVNFMSAEIEDEFPNSSKEDAQCVAVGITGIYFNVDSFTPLGKLPKLRSNSKAAALRLLGTLTL